MQNDLVNGFSGLKQPPETFLDDEDCEMEELGISDDEWFTNSVSEAFALEILIC